MCEIKPMPTTAEGFAADLRNASTCAGVVGMMWASQITGAAADLIEAQAARIAELQVAEAAALAHADGSNRLAVEMDKRATAAEAERDRMREALVEVVGCFSAASVEGLANVLLAEQSNTDTGSLYDLVTRRLLFADQAARAALAQTTGAGDE